MHHYLTLGPWRMSWRVIAIALMAIAATVSLGRWQTRRAEAKIVLQNHLVLAATGAALPIDTAHADPSTLVWHRVALSGTWVAEDVVYLDNRPMGDRVGFYVLMPLRLSSGALVLVDRGWLPRDAQVRTRMAPYRTPAGPVDVVGIALPDETHFMDLGQDKPKLGEIWENFSFDKFQAASGQVPLRLVVRQDSPSDDGLLRDWPDRGALLQGQIDRHYGYMVQWYAMAVAMVGLLIYYGLRAKPKHVH